MGGQKSLSAACPIAECAVEIVVEVAGQDQSGGGGAPPPPWHSATGASSACRRSTQQPPLQPLWPCPQPRPPRITCSLILTDSFAWVKLLAVCRHCPLTTVTSDQKSGDL